MRLRWTEAASRDLTGMCDYIKEHDGPAAARRVALQIWWDWPPHAICAPRPDLAYQRTGIPGLPFLAVVEINCPAISWLSPRHRPSNRSYSL
jgi:hypothetical protein